MLRGGLIAFGSGGSDTDSRTSLLNADLDRLLNLLRRS